MRNSIPGNTCGISSWLAFQMVLASSVLSRRMTASACFSIELKFALYVKSRRRALSLESKSALSDMYASRSIVLLRSVVTLTCVVDGDLPSLAA